MKKLGLIVVLFLGIFSLAQAQRDTTMRPSKTGMNHPPRMDPSERIAQETNHLKETLSLTDDQTTKVKDIYTKYMEQRREAFEKARESGEQMDRDEMRKQMTETMTQENNEIKAVLTDDQKVKFDQYIKEREERMKNRRGSRPGNN